MEQVIALLMPFKYILAIAFLIPLGLGAMIGIQYWKNPKRSMKVSLWGISLAIGEDKEGDKL